MTTTGRTRAELAAWLDRWNENGAAPSAETVAEFLGIELAPEPTLPVGQRRRSPEGVEVVKTDDGTTDPWRRYRGPGPAWRSDVEVADPGPAWFTDAEVAGWQIVTDAPEVPEDVIAAATAALVGDDEGTYDSNVQALARAGLLVGAPPEGPECDREHLPEGHVSIDLSGWADDDLRVAARGELGASLRAELARRGES